MRPRQQGLQCEPCGGWFHRVCGTGVSQETYREAIRNELSINWRCISCRSEDPDPETEQITLDTLNNNSTFFLPVLVSTPIHSPPISISPPLSNYESIIYSSSQQSIHTEGTIDIPVSGVNSSGSSFDMGIIHTSINSHEDSLDDDNPVNAHHSENPGIDYIILSTGSQRGNPALFDSRGFSYTMKVRGKIVTRWTCTKRPNCKATVSQPGNRFIPGEYNFITLKFNLNLYFN